jgi:vitamin B12 transporter
MAPASRFRPIPRPPVVVDRRRAHLRQVLLTSAALAALSFTSSALAQSAAPTNAAWVGEIVVTANRSPERLERVGQAVTVIDQADILRSQAVTVSDVLTRTPGVAMSRNGGYGGVTAIRIRGAEADQTMVVVDGVRLNDPASPGGGYNFASLLIGDADRIEVLRGSQSTLWGSQAIGGVVNVIYAEPKAPVEGKAQAEFGAHGTKDVRAGVGGLEKGVAWRLSAAHYDTDGISAYRFGSEKDGFRNTTLAGRVKAGVGGPVRLDLRGFYSRSRNESDGFPAPAFTFADTEESARTRDYLGYAGVEFDLLDGALTNRLGYSYTRTRRRQINPAQAVTTTTFESRASNRRWEYQGVWTFSPAWTATFGAESEDSSMRSASPSSFAPNPVPARAEAGVDSGYVQVRGEVVKGVAITAGLRHDDHEAYGGHTLGQADIAWTLNDGSTVLRASFGQGFKAPTLYQLYGPFGNLTLEPEEADGWDVGVEQRLADGRLRLRASWFSRKTTNQIDFASCTATSPAALCAPGGVRRFGYYDNIARARSQGLELEAEGVFGPLTLEGNYTYLDAKNRSAGSASYGRRLARRPEHSANLEATYAFENKATVGVAFHYVGKSYDDTANAFALKSYTKLDLRAAWPVTEAIEVYGRIENAWDDDYETVRNYGSPGRGAYVGVRGRF